MVFAAYIVLDRAFAVGFAVAEDLARGVAAGVSCGSCVSDLA